MEREKEPRPLARLVATLCLARVPLALLLAIAVVPPYVAWKGNELVGNLLVTEHPGSLALLIAMAFPPAWTAGLAVHLVVRHATARFGVDPPVWMVRWTRSQVGVLLWSSVPALFLVASLVACSEVAWLARVGGAVLGLAGGAVVLLVLAARWRRFLVKQARGTTWSVPAPLLRALALLGPGYVTMPGEAEELRVQPGHVPALLVLAGIVGVAVVLFFGARPDADTAAFVPPLVLLLLLIALLASFLPALTFLLDRWRVPLLLALALVVAVRSPLSNDDHRFALRASAFTPAAPEKVLPEGAGPVVVVSSEGGGILAAAWTALVLTGLEEECGQRFTSRLALVSGVSGGSVGLLHYVQGLQRDSARTPEQLARVRDHAMRSSLGATVWGVVFGELPRSVLPWLPFPDRAHALERAWARTLRSGAAPADATPTLATWSATAGTLPGVVLQSTLVESGQPFLFSTVDLSTAGGAVGGQGPLRFDLVYRTADVPMVTAARLSATFPYVSPAARAQGDAAPAWHLVDGGYAENYGITGVLAWLAELSGTDGREVLLIRIEPFVHDPDATAKERGQEPWKVGWLNELGAPLRAILQVRTASQRASVDALLETARQRLGGHLTEFVVRPEPLADDGSGKALPPNTLSWHLTTDEEMRLTSNWNELFRRAKRLHEQHDDVPHSPTVDALRELLDGIDAGK